MKKNISLVIFDLGNVVFKIDTMRTFNYWSKLTGKDPLFLKEIFFDDGTYVSYELGEISEERFRKHFSKKINFNISRADFVDGFNSMIAGLTPGIETVLEQVKGKRFLSTLSNTNKTHENFLFHNYPKILTYFDRLFFSHRIKSRKPDIEAFKTVLEYFRVEPDNCLFFDDQKENIDAANKFGINSFLVNSPSVEELKKILDEYGII